MAEQKVMEPYSAAHNIYLNAVTVQKFLEKTGISNGDIDGILQYLIDEDDPGTANYNNLTNKPAIEGITLIGNKTYDQLNLQRITNSEIEDLLVL